MYTPFTDQRVENESSNNVACVSRTLRNEWAQRARHARLTVSCSLWASRTRYDYSRGPLCFIALPATETALRDASFTDDPFSTFDFRSMRRGKRETKEKGRNDNRLTLVESSKTRSITSENFLLNKNPYFSYNNFYYKAKQRKIDPLFSLINVEEFWKFSGEGERRGERPRSIVERTQICGPVFDSPTYRLTNCL